MLKELLIKQLSSYDIINIIDDSKDIPKKIRLSVSTTKEQQNDIEKCWVVFDDMVKSSILNEISTSILKSISSYYYNNFKEFNIKIGELKDIYIDDKKRGYSIISAGSLTHIKDYRENMHDINVIYNNDNSNMNLYQVASYKWLSFYINPYLVWNDNRMIILDNKLDICIKKCEYTEFDGKHLCTVDFTVKYPESKLYILD